MSAADLRSIEVFLRLCRPLHCCKRRRPQFHALIVGADVVAYGSRREDGRSWGDWAKRDLSLDPNRTHWLGSLQTDDYHAVFAAVMSIFISQCHLCSVGVCLEAMAAGCSIVASDTPPVREVMTDGTERPPGRFLLQSSRPMQSSRFLIQRKREALV